MLSTIPILGGVVCTGEMLLAAGGTGMVSIALISFLLVIRVWSRYFQADSPSVFFAYSCHRHLLCVAVSRDQFSDESCCIIPRPTPAAHYDRYITVV